jgi:hypothetical protein
LGILSRHNRTTHEFASSFRDFSDFSPLYRESDNSCTLHIDNNSFALLPERKKKVSVFNRLYKDKQKDHTQAPSKTKLAPQKQPQQVPLYKRIDKVLHQHDRLIAHKREKYDRLREQKARDQGLKTDEEIVNERLLKEAKTRERMQKSGTCFEQMYQRFAREQSKRQEYLKRKQEESKCSFRPQISKSPTPLNQTVRMDSHDVVERLFTHQKKLDERLET